MNGIERVDRSRSRDALIGFLAPSVAVVLILLRGDGWIVFVPVSGMLDGLLVRDRVAGLLGLAVGWLVLAVAWATMIVARQIQSCQPACSGLSSPGITVAVAVVVGLVVQALAVVGFLGGRLIRRVAGSSGPKERQP